MIHHTYYDPRYLSRPADVRVSTVHDMIPELFPSLFKRNPHAGKHEYITKSDVIICVSKTTADDLTTIYPSTAPKIRVVPLGVDFDYYSQDRETSHGPPWPYLLYVGPRGSHKNFTALVHAFSALVDTDLRIIAAGGGPFNPQERSLLVQHGLEARTIQTEVTDAELAMYYRGAEALVVCSYYEGFGLTLLEAMAAGCPVITSNGGSLPEVAGSAALLFDPSQPEDLAEKIALLINDGSLRRTLIGQGRLRARQLSWENTAIGTARCYREVG